MTIKRFIAGAVCPACGVQDSVRVFRKEDRDIRECVDCGFSDAVQEMPALVGELPETRVSKTRLLKTRASHEGEGRHDTVNEDQNVQVVRILDS
ncbi:YheV family putative zinc ribbon protein [Endozoicomonas lisbonensis]|uniref:Metal-binding protein (TIGR02443 family) n=1 Tax=Endozoicomonas lisbonensis TaxID=3120522 RepID=A0ABV2SHH4_9GAMM